MTAAKKPGDGESSSDETLYGVRPSIVHAFDTATLIVQCARTRKESRGLHYNIDYPYRDNELFLKDTKLIRETH